MSEQTTQLITPSRAARDGLLVPAIFVVLGGVFLLGNLGYVTPLSLRSLASLWPLIPMLVGVQLLFGRERPSLALGLQLGAVVLGLAFVLLRGVPFATTVDAVVAPPIAGAPEAIVTATDLHFSSGEITLPSAAVNVTLRNDGVLPHDLTIPALGVHIAARSGESVTTGLRDLPKGRYVGICSVSDHADAGMRLTVTVD